MSRPNALIVGVGDGLSASLARLLAREGYALTLVARDTGKLDRLVTLTGAKAVACDVSRPADVAALFARLDRPLRVVVCNPSFRVRGPVATLDPEDVRRSLEVTAFGGFLVGQQAAAAMLAQEAEDGVRGTILFTGASAGVKGFAQSAPFAMGKFAQRGLAQSMARELHPQGIHVAWINIDGAIGNAGQSRPPAAPSARLDPDAIAERFLGLLDSKLDPDAIALAYLGLIRQHRSTWSDELTLRPWVEKF